MWSLACGSKVFSVFCHRFFAQRGEKPITKKEYTLIDHNNLEEFADPHNYDIEDNSADATCVSGACGAAVL